MSDKVVSKKFVYKDFSFVGIILSLYAFFGLYIPFLIENYLELDTFNFFANLSYDYLLVIKIFCLFFASLVPFTILLLSDSKLHNKTKKREKANIIDLLKNFLMFLCITALFTYINSSILSYFGIASSIVSNIGLSIEPKYFNDILYISIYIAFLPWLEEFAFRKCLLSVLGKYGKRFAVFTCSLMYALAHASIVDFLPCFVMSYFLCKGYLRYKSLTFVSIIHILYNLIMFLGFSISSEYNNYVLILIFSILLISLILFLSKQYTPTLLPKTDYNRNTFKMFITRKTVIFSILLFIGFAILKIVI